MLVGSAPIRTTALPPLVNPFLQPFYRIFESGDRRNKGCGVKLKKRDILHASNSFGEALLVVVKNERQTVKVVVTFKFARDIKALLIESINDSLHR